MKKTIILLFLLIFSIFVSAETITLIAGRSYEIDDRNVTLVKFDPENDKALFCVNGMKWIIAEGSQKTVNDVFIEVTKIKSDRVIADIEYRCKDCVCDESCDNSVCFDGEEELINGAENGDPSVVDPSDGEKTEKFKEEVIEPAGIGVQGAIIAVLVVIVLVLGLIVFWRRI